VDAVKRDLNFCIGENPHMHGGLGVWHGRRGAAETVSAMPLGCHHFTMSKGVYIDVANGEAH